MRKALEILLYTFIVVFFTILTVGHVTRGGQRLGKPITSAINFVISIPDVIREAFVEELPSYVKKTDAEIVNLLDEDLYAFHSFQEADKGMIVNLKDNEVIHEWEFPVVKTKTGSRYFGLPLPNKELVYFIYASSTMVRIDSNSNIIWQTTAPISFHHSMNLGVDGNIWVCGRHEPHGALLDTMFFNTKYAYAYLGEYITKVDINTGEILYEKSLTDIFMENGINPVLDYHAGSMFPGDVFHINDIEPVMKNAGKLQQGDVLISMRNQSKVIHFRPSTDSLLQIWDDGLYSQHDVDVINDSIISIFNNNVPGDLGPFSHLLFTPIEGKTWEETEKIVSQAVLLTYEGDTLHSPISDLMEEHEIFTITEGLIEYLPSGRVFLEEQNDYRIWVFKDNKVVYKGYFNHYVGEGFKEIPNWTKVYDNLDFLN